MPCLRAQEDPQGWAIREQNVLAKATLPIQAPQEVSGDVQEVMRDLAKSDQTRWVAVLLVLMALALSLFAATPRTAEAATKMDYYETGDNHSDQVSGADIFAQTFTATSTYVLTDVGVRIYKHGTATTLTVAVYETDNGSMNGVDYYTNLVDEATRSSSAVTSSTSGVFYSIAMTGEATLVENHVYAIVLSATGDNGTDAFYWREVLGGATYTGGNVEYSTDGGGTWVADTTSDFMFRTYGTLATDDEWESHDTGDNAVSTDNVYGDNWTAQTFTTGLTPHSVTRIGLKLYRTGWPGTVTVSIRDTENVTNIHPESGGDNVDICSGIIDGNVLTANAAGDWYYFQVDQAYLAVGHLYAIVLRAPDGATDNCVWWRLNDANPYADGNKEDSGDNGTTWASDLGSDYVFRIYGEQSDDIFDVAVFTDYREDGDWLIAVYYRCQVPPAYPGETTSQYMYFRFWSALHPAFTTKVGVMAWGFRPGFVYLSKQAVVDLGLHWERHYVVSIEPYAAKWNPDPAHIDYTMTSTNVDWVGNSKLALDYWVRTTAQSIEDEEGVDILTSTWGTIILPGGSDILTPSGGAMFLAALPDLSSIRPNLFSWTDKSFNIETGQWVHSGAHSPSTTLGAGVMASLTSVGAVIHLSGKDFGALLLFALVVIGANFLAKVTGDVRIPLSGGVVMILIIGWWSGLMSMAALAILIMLVVFMILWYIFLRNT